MKAVILAGGLGTRLSEETHSKPKPLVEIGGLPIIWHIMKIYSAYGVNEFIVCCGYKGHMLKEFFTKQVMFSSDIRVTVEDQEIEVLNEQIEPWRITLVDTGDNTMTGGRLKRIAKYIEDEELFCFTYGDGLADINIDSEIEFHKKHKRMATIATVPAPSRFGLVETDNDIVTSFEEKPRFTKDRINGGFFVLNPEVLQYIDGDATSWEREPLQTLAQTGQLMAYKHDGFWQPMDTLREKNLLNDMWHEGRAPWKVW